MIDKSHGRLGMEDNPIESSPARWLAEAAFTTRRSMPELRPPTVVVKRRRTVLQEEAEGSDRYPENARMEPGAPRAPKTFTVRATALPPGADETPANTTAVPDSHSDMSARIRRKRNRRTRLAGEVTIVRPVPIDAPEQSIYPCDSIDPPGHVEWNKKHGVVSKRLESLYAQLRVLEQLEKEARAHEKSNAVRWIRDAIQTYGLTASDLAF